MLKTNDEDNKKTSKEIKARDESVSCFWRTTGERRREKRGRSELAKGTKLYVRESSQVVGRSQGSNLTGDGRLLSVIREVGLDLGGVKG